MRKEQRKAIEPVKKDDVYVEISDRVGIVDLTENSEEDERSTKEQIELALRTKKGFSE